MVNRFLNHNSRTILFPDMWFLQKVRKPLLVSYSSKKVRMNELNYCQNPQNLIFGPFLDFFGSPDTTGLFFQKLGFVILLNWWLSNFIQKNQKKLMSQFWHLGVAKERTNMTNFLNYYLVAPWPSLGHFRGNSLTNPMLITAFLIRWFDSTVTGSLVARLGPKAQTGHLPILNVTP